MFYAIGHFSKWVPEGSVRIDAVTDRGLLDSIDCSVAGHGTAALTLILLSQCCIHKGGQEWNQCGIDYSNTQSQGKMGQQ